MKTSEVLNAALEKFGPKGERWTKGAYARNSADNKCNEFSSEAVCFCSLGAIRVVSGIVDDDSKAVVMLSEAILETYELDTVEFNDNPNREFADVARMFLYAIAKARVAGD